MTKKEIVDIIRVEFHGNGNYVEAFKKAAEKILAEEAKEKPTREELLTILSAWESVFGTSQLSHASARLQAAEDKVKRLEFQIAHPEKPVAPACPTCGVGIKLTERRIDGNSTCFNGHTHKTKDFYRPSPQADIVVELRALISRRYTNGVRGAWGDDIEEIIAKFEGAK